MSFMSSVKSLAMILICLDVLCFFMEAVKVCYDCCFDCYFGWKTLPVSQPVDLPFTYSHMLEWQRNLFVDSDSWMVRDYMLEPEFAQMPKEDQEYLFMLKFEYSKSLVHIPEEYDFSKLKAFAEKYNSF